MLGWAQIIKSVSDIADELITTDEEIAKIELQNQQLKHQARSQQLLVNKMEAQHVSIFVAGWRPAIGWIGAFSLGYQFIFYPLLIWIWSFAQAKGFIEPDLSPPPTLPADTLWVILSGMLGIAGIRSFDKVKKVQTNSMQK